MLERNWINIKGNDRCNVETNKNHQVVKFLNEKLNFANFLVPESYSIVNGIIPQA